MSGAYVASIAGLGADALGAMVSGNEVADCQHDKVGLSYDGEAMTLARWPNQAPAQPADETAPWRWSRAQGGCTRSPLGGSTFAMNTRDNPDALRLLKWRDEADAFVHGYWEWDWGDAYAPVSRIERRGDTVELSYRDAPTCKAGARWMGVNILSELDAPREYWIDQDNLLVYLFPPEQVPTPRTPPKKRNGRKLSPCRWRWWWCGGGDGGGVCMCVCGGGGGGGLGVACSPCLHAPRGVGAAKQTRRHRGVAAAHQNGPPFWLKQAGG